MGYNYHVAMYQMRCMQTQWVINKWRDAQVVCTHVQRWRAESGADHQYIGITWAEAWRCQRSAHVHGLYGTVSHNKAVPSYAPCLKIIVRYLNVYNLEKPELVFVIFGTQYPDIFSFSWRL